MSAILPLKHLKRLSPQLQSLLIGSWTLKLQLRLMPLFYFYFILFIIIAYCLLGQSPISDITCIALIMSISNYCGNRSPNMLCNLSQEAVAVRVGGIEMVTC